MTPLSHTRRLSSISLRAIHHFARRSTTTFRLKPTSKVSATHQVVLIQEDLVNQSSMSTVPHLPVRGVALSVMGHLSVRPLSPSTPIG